MNSYTASQTAFSPAEANVTPVAFLKVVDNKTELSTSAEHLQNIRHFPSNSILMNFDVYVLEQMSIDPSTPRAVLELLASHPHADVRAGLADNKNTPQRTLLQLAHDSNADVRYQLAENPHLPLEVLWVLSNDENPYVSCRAQKTISRNHIAE